MQGGAGVSRARRWCLVALAILFHLSFATFLAANAIEHDLLDPDYYSAALSDSNAYDRFYTQVLADPALAELTSDLLGGTSLGEERAMAVATLRLVLPPETLRDITEATIAALIAYLRGDSRRIDSQVDLRETLAALDGAISRQVRGLLATARIEHAGTLTAFRDLLTQMAAALQDGTLPAALPAVADAESLDIALDLLLGPRGLIADRTAGVQARAALAAGDTQGALLVMAGALVRQPASAAAARIERRLVQGRYFDPVNALSQAAGRPERDILARFNRLRDAAGVLAGPIRWASLIVLVATTLAFACAAARPRNLRWRAAGYLLLSAGVAWSLAWLIAGRIVEAPLTSALSAQGLGTPPPGVALLLADVDASLASQMTRTTLQATGLFALAGLAIAFASLAPLPALRMTWRRRPPLTGLVRVAAGLALIGAIAIAAWVNMGGLNRGPRQCNGQPELCHKSVNEAVFAATHNSMSSAGDGWVFPNQDAGITTQLEAGIRGLLIDTQYWDTDQSVTVLTRDRVPDNVSQALSGLVTSFGGPHEGVFLCHTLCTLGSQPLADGLGEIRRFLDRNRNEVVLVIFEDYVTPSDTQAAFRESGADRYVVAHRPGTPWPTLGQLVKSNRRLIVFSENNGPPPGWYNRFDAAFQDTPYDVADADGFTCAVSRGAATNPLLLLNNWIEKLSPDRSDAAAVNAYDALMRSVARCLQRGRRPNLIAVDFYSIGDVVKVAQDLNRR